MARMRDLQGKHPVQIPSFPPHPETGRVALSCQKVIAELDKHLQVRCAKGAIRDWCVSTGRRFDHVFVRSCFCVLLCAILGQHRM